LRGESADHDRSAGRERFDGDAALARAETEETSVIMGEDFWRYAVAEYRPEIEALTQYLYEKGLVDRKLGLEELFRASTFDIAKV
jgi:hypothetical protein